MSYNTRDLLGECLRSIAAAGVGLECETLVVDNASTDGSAEMVARDCPWVHLIRNETNRGFAGANNQAMRVGRGRYVLLLNSDATLLPGALTQMVRFMDTHPDAGGVGAGLLNPDGSFQASSADFPTLWSELLLLSKLARLVHPPGFPHHAQELSRNTRAVDWVSGACLLVRRAAVEEVGLLDEDYFMYTEETDWCYRMRRAGWRIYYLPLAKAVHWISQSARRAPERRRWQVYRSKWLYLRKHHGPWAAAAYAGAVRVASAPKLAAWAVACLWGDRATRSRAVGHVRSYLFLLGRSWASSWVQP